MQLQFHNHATRVAQKHLEAMDSLFQGYQRFQPCLTHQLEIDFAGQVYVSVNKLPRVHALSGTSDASMVC